MSTTSVLAAATGSASTSATDPVSPLLAPQLYSSSVGSAVPVDGEEEVLAGFVGQVSSASSRKSRKDSQDTEKILDLLQTGNEWTQKTLEMIDSTLPASTLN